MGGGGGSRVGLTAVKDSMVIFFLKASLTLKGLVPPRDREVFLDESHVWGKKMKFFWGQYFSFWMPLQNSISLLGV